MFDDILVIFFVVHLGSAIRSKSSNMTPNSGSETWLVRLDSWISKLEFNNPINRNTAAAKASIGEQCGLLPSWLNTGRNAEIDTCDLIGDWKVPRNNRLLGCSPEQCRVMTYQAKKHVLPWRLT